jgi:hypothetical protein
VGVAALTGEDGVDDGGEDFGFERSVGAGVSERAGVDELGPGVTLKTAIDPHAKAGLTVCPVVCPALFG